MLRPPDREERRSPGAAAQRVAHSLAHAHTFTAAGQAPTPLGNVAQVTMGPSGSASVASGRTASHHGPSSFEAGHWYPERGA